MDNDVDGAVELTSLWNFTTSGTGRRGDRTLRAISFSSVEAITPRPTATNGRSSRSSSSSSRGSRPASVLHFSSSSDNYEDRACRDVTPAVFFPDGKGKHADEAKAICAGCCVREKCLEEALARNERFGVWGGLTDRERLRLKRARRREQLEELSPAS